MCHGQPVPFPSRRFHSGLPGFLQTLAPCALGAGRGAPSVRLIQPQGSLPITSTQHPATPPILLSVQTPGHGRWSLDLPAGCGLLASGPAGSQVSGLRREVCNHLPGLSMVTDEPGRALPPPRHSWMELPPHSPGSAVLPPDGKRQLCHFGTRSQKQLRRNRKALCLLPVCLKAGHKRVKPSPIPSLPGRS